MAEKTQKEEEPSIEEILDSIRQIISDDDDEEEAEIEVEDSSPPEDDAADEVLDQSAVDDIDFDAPAVQEPVSVPEPEPEPEPDDDVLELTDRIDDEGAMDVDLRDGNDEDDIEPEPEPEPIIKDESDLFTNKAESAAVDAITQLVKKTAVERGGITLEEIVRSELKPLLRDWLDHNLPTLIERLVADELERVSKRLLED